VNNTRLSSSLVVIAVVSLLSLPARAKVIDAEAGGPHQRERAERDWAREPREHREQVEREMREQERERSEAARAEAARAAEARKAEIARAAKEAAAKAAILAAKEAAGFTSNPILEGAKIVLGSEVAGPAGFADKPGMTPERYREVKERADAERRVEPLRQLQDAIRRALFRPL
jgi:hypothetical protein